MLRHGCSWAFCIVFVAHLYCLSLSTTDHLDVIADLHCGGRDQLLPTLGYSREKNYGLTAVSLPLRKSNMCFTDAGGVGVQPPYVLLRDRDDPQRASFRQRT